MRSDNENTSTSESNPVEERTNNTLLSSYSSSHSSSTLISSTPQPPTSSSPAPGFIPTWVQQPSSSVEIASTLSLSELNLPLRQSSTAPPAHKVASSSRINFDRSLLNDENSKGIDAFTKLFPLATMEEYLIFCILSEIKNKKTVNGFISQSGRPQEWSLSKIVNQIQDFDLRVIRDKLLTYKSKMYSWSFDNTAGNDPKYKNRLDDKITAAEKFLVKFSTAIEKLKSSDLDSINHDSTVSALKNLRQIDGFAQATIEDYKHLIKISVQNRLQSSTRTKPNRLPTLELSGNKYKCWSKETIKEMLKSITPARVNSFFPSNPGKRCPRAHFRKDAIRVLQKFQSYFLAHAWKPEDFNIKGVPAPFSRTTTRKKAIKQTKGMLLDAKQRKEDSNIKGVPAPFSQETTRQEAINQAAEMLLDAKQRKEDFNIKGVPVPAPFSQETTRQEAINQAAEMLLDAKQRKEVTRQSSLGHEPLNFSSAPFPGDISAPVGNSSRLPGISLGMGSNPSNVISYPRPFFINSSLFSNVPLQTPLTSESLFLNNVNSAPLPTHISAPAGNPFHYSGIFLGRGSNYPLNTMSCPNSFSFNSGYFSNLPAPIPLTSKNPLLISSTSPHQLEQKLNNNSPVIFPSNISAPEASSNSSSSSAPTPRSAFSAFTNSTSQAQLLGKRHFSEELRQPSEKKNRSNPLELLASAPADPQPIENRLDVLAHVALDNKHPRKSQQSRINFFPLPRREQPSETIASQTTNKNDDSAQSESYDNKTK